MVVVVVTVMGDVSVSTSVLHTINEKELGRFVIVVFNSVGSRIYQALGERGE